MAVIEQCGGVDDAIEGLSYPTVSRGAAAGGEGKGLE